MLFLFSLYFYATTFHRQILCFLNHYIHLTATVTTSQTDIKIYLFFLYFTRKCTISNRLLLTLAPQNTGNPFPFVAHIYDLQYLTQRGGQQRPGVPSWLYHPFQLCSLYCSLYCLSVDYNHYNPLI